MQIQRAVERGNLLHLHHCVLGQASGPAWLEPGFLRTWATLVAQMVKRLPAMQETRVWSLGQKDPPKKKMAAQSSTLAWKIPWMEEPGGLQSMGLQRIGHNWVTSLSFFLSWEWLSVNEVGEVGRSLIIKLLESHDRLKENSLPFSRKPVETLSKKNI